MIMEPNYSVCNGAFGLPNIVGYHGGLILILDNKGIRGILILTIM